MQGDAEFLSSTVGALDFSSFLAQTRVNRAHRGPLAKAFEGSSGDGRQPESKMNSEVSFDLELWAVSLKVSFEEPPSGFKSPLHEFKSPLGG